MLALDRPDFPVEPDVLVTAFDGGVSRAIVNEIRVKVARHGIPVGGIDGVEHGLEVGTSHRHSRMKRRTPTSGEQRETTAIPSIGQARDEPVPSAMPLSRCSFLAAAAMAPLVSPHLG